MICPRGVGRSNLTVHELEEVVVAENTFLVYGDEESLGKVHRRIGFGELQSVVSTARGTETRIRAR